MSKFKKFRKVRSYDEITEYFDQLYNTPKIPDEISEEAFEAEFFGAHDTLIDHMRKIGSTTEKSNLVADFYFYRYVELCRSITIVSYRYHPDVIFAVQGAQEELPHDYVINLDSSPGYISILPNGEVLGYASNKKGREILRQYGFE